MLYLLKMDLIVALKDSLIDPFSIKDAWVFKITLFLQSSIVFYFSNWIVYYQYSLEKLQYHLHFQFLLIEIKELNNYLLFESVNYLKLD